MEGGTALTTAIGWHQNGECPPEVRAKIGATLTGRQLAPDHAAKVRAAGKARSSDRSPVWKGTDISYNGAHNRARRVLAEDPCALADATCSPRLEVALRADAPPELIRVSPRGFSYFAGEDSRGGYIRLCTSHHRRYDLGLL